MQLFYDIVCFMHKVIGKIWLRMEVKFVGVDELPYKGPLIIAPNHASYLDPPLIAALWWPKRLDFFASHHLYKGKILGWALRHLRTHPLVRESGIKALRQALRFLAEGKTIVIFPEGTRSRSGSVGGLKKGIAMLSCKGKCPVVPVFISGTYDVWPPGQKYPTLFSRKKIIFYVGKPLSSCPEVEEGYTEWLNQLKIAYDELKDASEAHNDKGSRS